MSQETQAKGRDFAKFLTTLSVEQIAHGNEVNYKAAEAEYQDFLEHFSRGSCYICNRPLNSFSKKSPCPHWLLKPKGFKKNDLPALSKRYGLYQIQSFLRWVANQDGFARNINDLPEEEGTCTKLFEVTIKYKGFEWAFSCAESDYQGHATSQHAKHQHYHFQMRIDRRPFINYSDFHVPFSEMDIINIEAMRANPKMKQRFSFGEGMNSVLSEETVEHIVNSTIPGDNEEEAPFKLDSIAMAEEGKTISGDDVYQLIQEAKAKGVTLASLMHKLPNARTQVIVTPGPGVVEQAPRSGRKKDA